MTIVNFFDKSTASLVETMSFTKDETLEMLLYWVKVALAGSPSQFAEFQYESSLYMVEVDE